MFVLSFTLARAFFYGPILLRKTSLDRAQYYTSNSTYSKRIFVFKIPREI